MKAWFLFIFSTCCGTSEPLLKERVHVVVGDLEKTIPELIGPSGSPVTFVLDRLPGKIIAQTDCTKTDCKISVHSGYDTCDLDHVLFHELGHALGLKHVPDETNIMYVDCDAHDIPNATAAQQLADACAAAPCRMLDLPME